MHKSFYVNVVIVLHIEKIPRVRGKRVFFFVFPMIKSERFSGFEVKMMIDELHIAIHNSIQTSVERIIKVKNTVFFEE